MKKKPSTGGKEAPETGHARILTACNMKPVGPATDQERTLDAENNPFARKEHALRDPTWVRAWTGRKSSPPQADGKKHQPGGNHATRAEKKPCAGGKRTPDKPGFLTLAGGIKEPACARLLSGGSLDELGSSPEWARNEPSAGRWKKNPLGRKRNLARAQEEPLTSMERAEKKPQTGGKETLRSPKIV